MTTGCRNPHTLRSTETLDIGSGLSLVPRLSLLLSFFRPDPCVRPVDEWKIKRSILDFLQSPSTAGNALDVSESDIEVHRCKDLKKRKRDEPVASGVLRIYDLSSLKKKIAAADDGRSDEEIYEEWKVALVSRMDGMELNLEGTKFRLSVEVPVSDRFESVKKSWEEFYGGNNPRGTRRRPDTLMIMGIPSRWLAEPRVSSKASTLVTHTIFSVFGKIRNLNITSDDDLCKINDTNSGIMPDLYCKIWVQFENFEDFCNALKVLCGRSLQKLGSRLKVNYGVTWDKDGLFQIMQHKAPGHIQQGVPQDLCLSTIQEVTCHIIILNRCILNQNLPVQGGSEISSPGGNDEGWHEYLWFEVADFVLLHYMFVAAVAAVEMGIVLNLSQSPDNVDNNTPCTVVCKR